MKNWQIQIWNKKKNKLLHVAIREKEIKPIAMMNVFHEFIFHSEMNDLDDLDHLEFIIQNC